VAKVQIGLTFTNHPCASGINRPAQMDNPMG
jgi:hypothetical protein